jgi:hypothetical protein
MSDTSVKFPTVKSVAIRRLYCFVEAPFYNNMAKKKNNQTYNKGNRRSPRIASRLLLEQQWQQQLEQQRRQVQQQQEQDRNRFVRRQSDNRLVHLSVGPRSNRECNTLVLNAAGRRHQDMVRQEAATMEYAIQPNGLTSGEPQQQLEQVQSTMDEQQVVAIGVAASVVAQQQQDDEEDIEL